MEHLKCLFRFKNYHVSDTQKAVICLALDSDRDRKVVMSRSEKYLILWERGQVPIVETNTECRYVETHIEVIAVVYETETGIVYPIPQGQLLHGVKYVNIQISPNERFAMIVTSNLLDRVVTWWNLETKKIVRTISMMAIYHSDVWTLTDDHLIELKYDDTAIYYSVDKSEIRNIMTVPYGNVGWIIVNDKYARLREFDNSVELSSFDESCSNIFPLQIPPDFDIFEHSTAPFQGFLILILYNENFCIMDIFNTGHSLLTSTYHDDFKSWFEYHSITTDYEEPIKDAIQIVVLQKRTLVRLFNMVLSSLIIPIYHRLPNTLRYLVCEILSN